MKTPARSQRPKSAGTSGAPASGAPGEGAAPSAGSPAAAASPDCVARLVPLDPGFYAFSLAAETNWREPIAGLAVPAIHICAPPDIGGAIEISDGFGRATRGMAETGIAELGLAGSWLGGRRRMLFVRSPEGGGAALVTAYLARDPDAAPLDLEIRRLGASDDRAAEAALGLSGGAVPELPVLMTLRMGDRAQAHRPPQPASLDIVAHIRGRGDVRFVDSPWVGRLGSGLWIEAFTILPRSPAVAAAIEYKGLTASGAETPWLACGSPCGTTGRGIPLIGFAIRQKAVPGGARFDCEYGGAFESGATAGPARNGAPCRSARDNDPLLGLQVRIVARPVPAASG